ncbi:MAG: AraC family transcriptional regulator [Solimonas sp.]
MAADPLSQVLELLNARCRMSGGLVSGGPFSLRFQAHGIIKFSAVAEGGCWLLMDCLPVPRRLETGDVIVIDGRHPMVLASDPALPPQDAHSAYTRRPGQDATIGVGRDFRLLGGLVEIDHARQDLLLDALPPLIHVRGAAPEAIALRWLLEQMIAEIGHERPGGEMATAQLAQLMFMQALRAHLGDAESDARGWLRALGDERIAPALRLMHGRPAHPWTLEQLAHAVAMSRTTFAERFKAAVGSAPLAYLRDWRMHLAERDLRESDTPVSSIAYAVGYTSESAFSNAFKRMTNLAPQRYRTQAREAVAQPG